MGIRGTGRILHDQYLHDLQSTTDTLEVMKSRRTRWAEHIARMVKDAYGVLVEKREG